MANERQSGGLGRHRAGGAARGRQRSAAGAPVEPAVLRRSRHADRHRRHLVLPQNADRPARPGQAVRLGAQARGRPLFPGHAGREMRHHGRRCAVPGGRDEGRGRARGPRAALSHQRRRLGRLRAATMRCGSSRNPAPAGSSPTCMCAAICGPRCRGRCSTIWSSSARSATSTARAMFGVDFGGEFFAMAPADSLREFA